MEKFNVIEASDLARINKQYIYKWKTRNGQVVGEVLQ